jgi:hypothetical protein
VSIPIFILISSVEGKGGGGGGGRRPGRTYLRDRGHECQLRDGFRGLVREG